MEGCTGASPGQDGGELQSSASWCSPGRCGASQARTGGEVGANGKQRKSSLHHIGIHMLELAWERPLCLGTSTKTQLLFQISSEKQQNNPALHPKRGTACNGLGGSRDPRYPL